MGRVLIAGAAGVIGRVLMDRLGDRHALVGVDRARRRSPGVHRADVSRARSLVQLLDGVDTVVDLATGSRVELAWKEVFRDCRGRVSLLQQLSRHGVKRYVFASSSHVAGGYEVQSPYAAILAGAYEGLDPRATPLIAPVAAPRPDSPYAVGKVFGEAAARHYSDRHDLSCLCLRIGTVMRDDRPTRSRHFATLLSHADLSGLVDACIQAPLERRFGVYYGVSNNTWRIWDITNAREELGFEPQDDAERFRGATSDSS